jgi:hypothetical protein
MSFVGVYGSESKSPPSSSSSVIRLPEEPLKDYVKDRAKTIPGFFEHTDLLKRAGYPSGIYLDINLMSPTSAAAEFEQLRPFCLADEELHLQLSNENPGQFQIQPGHRALPAEKVIQRLQECCDDLNAVLSFMILYFPRDFLPRLSFHSICIYEGHNTREEALYGLRQMWMKRVVSILTNIMFLDLERGDTTANELLQVVPEVSQGRLRKGYDTGTVLLLDVRDFAVLKRAGIPLDVYELTINGMGADLTQAQMLERLGGSIPNNLLHPWADKINGDYKDWPFPGVIRFPGFLPSVRAINFWAGVRWRLPPPTLDKKSTLIRYGVNIRYVRYEGDIFVLKEVADSVDIPSYSSRALYENCPIIGIAEEDTTGFSRVFQNRL